MRAAYDVDRVRAAEQPLLKALPEGTLMQRAATALARRCAALLGSVYGAHVVVLAGKGNNGGDAQLAGGQLAGRGARVDVVHATGEVELDTVRSLLASADLVIDGMVGIGGTGGLREPAASIAQLLTGTAAAVVAVDVPSGVDASTGEVAGRAVRADVTVTFGAIKTGLLVAPGADYAGTVEVVDIGLALPPSDVTVLDAADVAQRLPVPAGETDKYRRGVLGVVAGSDRYTGAAVLAVGGALAAGVGMVRFTGAQHPAELVRQRWPETVVTVVSPGDGDAVLAAGRVQAWVVGSGLGTDGSATAWLRSVLTADVPVLLDADAITIVAEHPDLLRSRLAPTLLTPHAGEFARLRGVERTDVEAHRLSRIRAAARELGATVLLKGSTTLVADPTGAVRINTADTPYLATAGSGDVLSGICGALLAGGLPALDAASAGAFLHGLAGLLAASVPAAPVTAMDLVRALPAAIRAVREEEQP